MGMSSKVDDGLFNFTSCRSMINSLSSILPSKLERYIISHVCLEMHATSDNFEILLIISRQLKRVGGFYLK